MNISQNNFPSNIKLTNQLIANQKRANIETSAATNASSFQSILEKKQGVDAGFELKFSKHANERLLSRKIDLSESQLERLEMGAKKASEKGINESLVMVDDLAFIVNIKSSTVVTAVNDSEDKVFTNIDGAVII